MKVNDKIANYEMNQYVIKSAPNINEGQPLLNGQKNQGVKAEIQDTIVNLSRASKELRLASETIASTPDVREEKLAEIKDKIESGNYRIDNRAVAEKIVGSFIDELF